MTQVFIRPVDIQSSGAFCSGIGTLRDIRHIDVLSLVKDLDEWAHLSLKTPLGWKMAAAVSSIENKEKLRGSGCTRWLEAGCTPVFQKRK